FQGTYEGWYCPRCADFKTDAELIEADKCPIHLIVLEREKEDNWFFKLSAFQERLEALYAENPEWVRPKERYNEALSFIKGGLNDLSLSRARIRWGVEVPWDPEQVIYVWIDALINYYSALSYARPGEDLTERYWPATVHLIAKDILKFHLVIWPAMLMAAGIELPRNCYVHGYLLQGDHKMSKSLGNVIDPFGVAEKYGTDALRFYLLREVGFGQDGSVSTEGFEKRYTSELANEYGNLASRSLAMIGRYRHGVVPAGQPPAALVAEFAGLEEELSERFDVFDLSGALDLIWQRIKRLNSYVTEQEPWQMAKEPDRAGELDAVLLGLAEGLRSVSILLAPFMPEATTKLLEALGVSDASIGAAGFGDGAAGNRIGELAPLFPRIEAGAA
nr:methionine--tRNA ligase [Thermoleophilaceae bacterium]